MAPRQEQFPLSLDSLRDLTFLCKRFIDTLSSRMSNDRLMVEPFSFHHSCPSCVENKS